MFDSIFSTSTSNASSGTRSELDRYLATDVEVVSDVLGWWWERRSMYPGLSRMALDYLSIPGMSYIRLHYYMLSADLYSSNICRC